MKVPSYDDLARSIPDIHPRDTFDQATRLVPSAQPVVEIRAGAAEMHHGAALFACVTARNQVHAGAVMALAREFSPRIERHGAACVVLDVSGLGRLLGDAHGIAAEIARTAADRGLKARISIAPTQTAARLLALCDDAPSVVTGDVTRALSELPLALLENLRPPGTAATRSDPLVVMPRWGIRSVGEFAALPAGDVSARFGQNGVALHRLACGIDARPLVPDPGVPRFLQMMELEWPLDSLEPLSFVFARLLEPLSSSLERADRAGTALRLDLRLVDKSIHTRVLQLPAPIRDARVLRTLLLLDLESHPPSAAIDIVTIEVDPAPSRIVQYSLLQRATPSPETLATLNARLFALVGEDRCGSPILIDSHRPDAFVMARFNPADAIEANPGTLEPLNLGTLEPLNLGTLEPLNLGTLAPRHPGTLHVRRFRPSVAIRVAVERGRPVHVAIDRKRMPGGRVKQAAGPWRSSGAWWDAAAQHWDRDEWDIAVADGSVCRIYLDRVSDQWFLEGVID